MTGWRCALDPDDERCSGCPYWPLCRRADREAWNAPERRPADWQLQVEEAEVAILLAAHAEKCEKNHTT